MHKKPVPSPSYTQDLLEKIRDLPDDKIAEVADFVEFLRQRQTRIATTREERLRAAAQAGILVPPKPGAQRSSVRELPPAVVPGKPASEIVIEDRR
jgi:hypothetical protein